MKPPEPLEPFEEAIELPKEFAAQDGPIVSVRWDSRSGVHTNIACVEPHDRSTLPAFWHPYPRYVIRKNRMPLGAFKKPLELPEELAKEDGPIVGVEYEDPPDEYISACSCPVNNKKHDHTYVGNKGRTVSVVKIRKKAP